MLLLIWHMYFLCVCILYIVVIIIYILCLWNLENVGEYCKAQWVCVPQRIALYKSYLLLLCNYHRSTPGWWWPLAPSTGFFTCWTFRCTSGTSASSWPPSSVAWRPWLSTSSPRRCGARGQGCLLPASLPSVRPGLPCFPVFWWSSFEVGGEGGGRDWVSQFFFSGWVHLWLGG